MFQLEYGECLHFWSASWVEEVCWKAKRISYVALGSIREKSQKLDHEEEPIAQGEMSSYLSSELICRMGLSFSCLDP